MLYSSFKDSTLFDSIHVDVLRLFPFTDGLLPSIEDTLVIYKQYIFICLFIVYINFFCLT